MLYTRIRVTIIVLLVFTNIMYAQDTTAKYILANIFTSADEKYRSTNNKEIYIIVTDKTCSKCFIEFCDNVAPSKYDTYNISIIGTIKHDLLKMISLATHYKKIIPCGMEVLFHFTDGNVLNSVYSTPSPQLIIKDNEGIRYYPYAKTMDFIHALNAK